MKINSNYQQALYLIDEARLLLITAEGEVKQQLRKLEAKEKALDEKIMRLEYCEMVGSFIGTELDEAYDEQLYIAQWIMAISGELDIIQTIQDKLK